MTYIQSEAVDNQPLVEEILDLATIALQKEDWLRVSNYLKQLPLTNQHRTKLYALSATNWQIAFSLALAMLLNADFEHRWEISKIFSSFGRDIVAPLSDLLLDEAVEIECRWFICQILGNFRESEVVLALVKLLLQTRDEELMAIAGKTLTSIGDGAIDALTALYSQPEYRFLAVKSLCYIHTAATIEPLIGMTQSSNPELRAMTLKALGSFHDRRILPVMIEALEDVASSVRQQAAIALGFRKDVCKEFALVSYLEPLLYDLDLQVCRQAATSLGRMQQKSANLALYKVLQADTTPQTLKIDAAKALCWSNTDSAIDYLQQSLASKDRLLVQEIIVSLGRISDRALKQKSAAILVKFWQEQTLSTPLKQALATSLGELRCSCAQATLEQLAQSGERKVQLHAIAALKKVLNQF